MSYLASILECRAMSPAEEFGFKRKPIEPARRWAQLRIFPKTMAGAGARQTSSGRGGDGTWAETRHPGDSASRRRDVSGARGRQQGYCFLTAMPDNESVPSCGVAWRRRLPRVRRGIFELGSLGRRGATLPHFVASCQDTPKYRAGPWRPLRRPGPSSPGEAMRLRGRVIFYATVCL